MENFYGFAYNKFFNQGIHRLPFIAFNERVCNRCLQLLHVMQIFLSSPKMMIKCCIACKKVGKHAHAILQNSVLTTYECNKFLAQRVKFVKIDLKYVK